jgi:hypothetical protein
LNRAILEYVVEYVTEFEGRVGQTDLWITVSPEILRIVSPSRSEVVEYFYCH